MANDGRNSHAADPGDTVDFTPSTSNALHTEPVLCAKILDTVQSSVPLGIRSSDISMGSGLFAAADVDAGQEIYHFETKMKALNGGHDSICHYCFEDTQDGLGKEFKPESQAKACTGCRAARFCSQGGQVRVRSLKKIAANDEITICYMDPTLDVSARQALLRRHWFFDCYCTRCKAELREQRSLLGDSNKLPMLHEAQRNILSLIRKAVHASKYPGIFPDHEDLATLETRLRTATSSAFPAGTPWPAHMEPLPSARLSLAIIALKQGKPVPALRNVLKGMLLSNRKTNEPEWVNEMMDVVDVLMTAGSLPPDAAAFEDKSFPAVGEIRIVTYGYLWAMSKAAISVFGGGALYAKGVCQLMAAVLAKKKSGATPGTKEFYEAEYQPAQKKLLAWAGVPDGEGDCRSHAELT
ncbi:hypothetical protein N658DRAFT_477635 [Parathielavia hyrcaniae]|uniref:SET domain-containing protein n=1 Tax=Parathielavia hyrcaniae TaxID=113614 RepID=A0AAN6PUD0_9PEZI|nr:hypothetical protein N658DRAFT_477635 [Parathielavia hyrcaniae]